MSRIRTNLITNRMANGAPTVSNGLVISGVTTASTLDVNGTSDFSGDAVFNSDVDIVDAIVHVGDTDTKIRFPAADTISFETAGSEVLSMNLDGLVTGGQTNPTSSDNGNIYIKNGSSIGGVGHAVNYVSNAVFNGAWKYINSGTGATRIVVNQNGFQFDGAGSGTAGNNITFNPALNISSLGAHKITCTASHYSANLSEMNTGNLALNIIKSRQGETKGIGFGAIGSSTSNTGIQAYDTSNNSANPLLINPFGGNVIIGDTSDGNAFSGGDSLVIGNTSSGTRSGMTLVSANDQDGGIYFSDGTSSGSAYVRGQIVYDHSGDSMQFYTANSKRMRILGDGRVLINTDDGAAFSSRKLTISDISGGGTTAMEIRSATNGTGRIYFTDSTSSSNAGSYAAKVFYDHADDHMAFYTGGSTNTPGARMKIDAYGRVTKPNQPLFVAQKSGAITGTGFVTFNTVIENVGSCYNSSDGKFTAPVAGYYWFCCKINAYKRIDFYFKRNGSNSGSANREIGQFNTSNQDGWYSHNLIRIFELAANDYVQVDVTNIHQNSDPNEWITFQGYLLQ